MKLYSVCIFWILFSLVSCETQRNSSLKIYSNSVKPNNDTTRIIEAAIRSIFEPLDLPGISSLKKPYHFGDSILFSSNAILATLLPKYCDSLKFKVLPVTKIQSMIKFDSGKISTPNYLFIDKLEKNDSLYTVLISSNSGLWYGSGGSFLIDIAKEKDSFVVKHRLSGSIN